MNENTMSRAADNRELPTAQGNGFSRALRKLYAFLASVKLAMALLIAILASCVVGVTIFRGQRAGELIFGTLWFNGLLVLLVLNVGFCFFGRMWGRKLTPIFLGMVLFHLSFVAILGGIIYNSFFHFAGLIRLTEGETLPSGELLSYDRADYGRFFSFSNLKGETTLIKMHVGYKVDGLNKRAAYEIAVGEGLSKKQEIIFITKKLNHYGVSYISDSREGYSILIMLYDKQGRELYGGYIPLQSFKQKDDTYLYMTGTKDGPGGFQFPQGPLKPLFDLQITYHPDPKKAGDGEVVFRTRLLAESGPRQTEKSIAEVKASVGNRARVGEYYLKAAEVRYWAGMSVRYDPGKPIVLTSLGVGLGGMIITFIGRIRRNSI